jgi:hypothetical protein
MSSSNLLDRPGAVWADIHQLVDEGRCGEIAARDVQRLLAAAVRLYAAKADTEGYFPIVPPGTITATDAMIVSTALLKAVNIAVFELGLWQSWAGTTEAGES